jgi:glycosyltransferase involved in cell wall biosynthesis
VMKYVLIHLYNDRSGSPKVLSQIARAFQSAGTDFSVITSSHGYGFLGGFRNGEGSVFYRRSENKLLTLFYYFVSQLHLFFKCLKYINKDVVFYVNTMMPFGAAMAALVMRKRVIYHVHETSLRPRVLKKFLRLVVRLSADKVIFVSEYLRRVEGFDGKSQYVVYNAIETPLCESGIEKVRQKFNILMVCSLKGYKGVFEFFEVAKLCLNHSYISFNLVLNADQGEIDTLLGSIVIPSNVTVFPRQQNVCEFYTKADMLLNLSRPDECVETFGLTLIEAMACGLPVIAPPVGGPTEIVRDGVDGYLISCYETAAVADTIISLSSDADTYARLANNAKARVHDFSIDRFEEKILKIALFEDSN